MNTSSKETLAEIKKSKNEFVVDKILNALIEKDENELWRIGYMEGKDGFLYSVDFKSYEILNILSFQRADTVEEFVYTVELNISKSSDIRFPVGTSIWNIGILESEFCIFFYLKQ